MMMLHTQVGYGGRPRPDWDLVAQGGVWELVAKVDAIPVLVRRMVFERATVAAQ